MSKWQIGVGEGWQHCGRRLTTAEEAVLEAQGFHVAHNAHVSFTRKPGDGVFEPREIGPDPLFKARS